MKLAGIALFACLLPAVAAAQNSGMFIQAGPLLDLLANDIDSDRIWHPSEEDGLSLPAFAWRQISTKSSSPGAFAAIGVFLSPALSLRLESSFSGQHVTTAETDTPSGQQSESTIVRQAATDRDMIVAAGIHRGPSRARITYLAGMVFRRQRQESTATTGFLEQHVGATFYRTGLMAGLDFSLALSQRLAIVPQIRMVAANHDWNLRPALAMRWRP